MILVIMQDCRRTSAPALFTASSWTANLKSIPIQLHASNPMGRMALLK
jgi:hypothetical protein